MANRSTWVFLPWFPSGQSSIRQLNSDVGGKYVIHRDRVAIPHGVFSIRSDELRRHLEIPCSHVANSQAHVIKVYQDQRKNKFSNTDREIQRWQSLALVLLKFRARRSGAQSLTLLGLEWNGDKFCDDIPRQFKVFSTCAVT